MTKLELLAAILGESTPAESPSKGGIFSHCIGRYCIVRSRNEGVNAGVVVDADETGIVLKNARRLWYHKPAVTTESWYEGVANHGVSEDSKLSGTVDLKVIVEDYSATPCSADAERSIRGAKCYEN